MKKLLCILLFCLSFTYTFSWMVDDIRDEFGDKTGEKEVILISKNKVMSIRKIFDSRYAICYIDGNKNFIEEKKEQIVKVKIDNLKSFKLKRTRAYYDYGFIGMITSQELNLLANGKIAKFSMPQYDGTHCIIIVDLTGLKSSIKKTKWE